MRAEFFSIDKILRGSAKDNTVKKDRECSKRRVSSVGRHGISLTEHVSSRRHIFAGKTRPITRIPLLRIGAFTAREKRPQRP